jgi:hypothetical protein
MRRVSVKSRIAVMGGVLGLAVLAAACPTISAGSSASSRPAGAQLARTLACGDSASPEPSIFDTWCGNWEVDFFGVPAGPFGQSKGHIAFTRISQDEGNAAANQDFGVFPFRAYVCDRSRLYYRGRFDWGGGGDVIACTVKNGSGLAGRYKLDTIQNTDCCGLAQSGDISLTGGGNTFVGSYGVDNSNHPEFRWSGRYLGGGVRRLRKPQRKRKRHVKKKTSGCNPPHKHGHSPPCHWVVSFHLSQRGLPYRPTSPPNLAADDTSAVGKIFFNAKPREGRRAFGNAAGGVVFSRDLLEPTLQTNTTSVSLKLTAGRYTLSSHERQLLLVGEMTDIEGNKGTAFDFCEVGDSAHLVLTDDKRTGDFYAFRLNCNPTGPGAMRYANNGKDKLRVTISPPKRL